MSTEILVVTLKPGVSSSAGEFHRDVGKGPLEANESVLRGPVVYVRKSKRWRCREVSPGTP